MPSYSCPNVYYITKLSGSSVMDTCSERSFRSQKSSASYTGTVNSRRPLLAGHASAAGDFSQSYYSDDEPQRRNLHRQRFQGAPPSRLQPLPPVPSQPVSRDSRGYIEMSSPRTSEQDLLRRPNGHHLKDANLRQR